MKNNPTKSKIRPMVLAIGAGLALGLVNLPIANAATPQTFKADKLTTGYKVAGHGKQCPGKCGGKMKSKDGKCGSKMKGKDGKCGSGKCGGKNKTKKS